ncbi:MAG: PKD domain-containing protein [Thermoplasmata archaeon]|nr:PKD domain-containing protein [Thermoplasmata archaeon]
MSAAIVLAFSMVPASLFTSGPVGEASAQDGYYVRVGFQQDFSNWNPLAIEMVSDYVACYLIYSVLFQFDEDWNEVVGDLATDWYQVTHSGGNMTTVVNITENAYFRNAADPMNMDHQLTAYDVEYTYELVMSHPGGTWDYYLYDVTGVNATGEFQVSIDTSYTKATLIEDLVWIPILPMYQWETILESQLLKAMTPDSLIGSGPFYFDSMVKNSWYEFTTAPNYHGEADYGEARDIDIDGIIYSIYTEPSAMVIAMNDAAVDTAVFSGNANNFQDEVGVGSVYPVQKAVCQEMGIIDIAINAIPVEFRTSNYGNGNPLLLDPAVRLAIAMTLDKQFIVDSLMLGYPVVADSVIDPGYWHLDVTENAYSYDPAAARDILLDAGYVDSGDGILEATAEAWPVVNGWASEGDRLEFALEAPDTDPSYASIGNSWVGWADDAGIQFTYTTRAEGVMVSDAWYQADYDVWIWAWLWGPEPLSNLAVWLTSEIREGGNNCQMPMGEWYYDWTNYTDAPEEWGIVGPYSSFDQNLTLGQSTLDKAERQQIVFDLQQMIYDSYTEIPPFYPLGLYAWHENNYVNWGNWDDHVGRSTTSDLLWLWYDLEPSGGNQMPVFDTPLLTDYQPIIDEPITFTVSVHDPEGDPMELTWNFGDGSDPAYNNSAGGSSEPATFTQTHTYTELASDGLAMNVTAYDGSVNATSRATVYVLSVPDAVPSITRPVLSDPLDMVYVGESSTWSVGVTDAEATEVTVTWDWGDGTYDTTVHTPSTPGDEVIDTAVHAWDYVGTFDVELFVWDGSDLPGHNISGGVFPYEVIENTPPTDPVIGSISANSGVWVECVASSSDLDADELTFTWDFGSGVYNVTSATPATGTEAATSIVMHLWSAAGSYPVTVWVDDGEDHNVSASVTAEILGPGVEVPPGSELLVITPTPAYVGATVTFDASAVDTNSDALTFYIEFGDGEAEVETTDGGTTLSQAVQFEHVYESEDIYSVVLYVDDGSGLAGHNISVSADLSVVEFVNSPPWLQLASSTSAMYNRTVTLTPSVCRDNDTDPLTVWYDWGDGTDLSMGEGEFYAGTHVYEAVGEFDVVVHADDGTGLDDHNVSATVVMTVSENLRPSFNGSAVMTPSGPYEEGAVITFTFEFKDYEGDTVNITVDFGDGSDVEVLTFEPEANVWTTESVEHTYAEGSSDPYVVTITADDGMMDFHSVKTWQSLTTSVTVEPPEESDILLYVAVGAILLVVLGLVAYMVLKKKKKGDEGPGGMEGTAPPPPPQ